MITDRNLRHFSFSSKHLLNIYALMFIFTAKKSKAEKETNYKQSLDGSLSFLAVFFLHLAISTKYEIILIELSHVNSPFDVLFQFIFYFKHNNLNWVILNVGNNLFQEYIWVTTLFLCDEWSEWLWSEISMVDQRRYGMHLFHS